MPLRCIDDVDQTYVAWRLSAEHWASLRNENKKRQHLRMPCCGASVVLRTSKLGTRHFAHTRKGECATAPETAEHLLAKLVIAEAAEKTGWKAQTEYRGKTPEGDGWVADVFAEKGNAQVAFEVQWSRQDIAETEARQARYLRSGIRCLWLMRNVPGVPNKDLPMVRLRIEPPHFTPLVDIENIWYDRKPPPIPLATFIEGALNRRLRFAPLLGQTIPIDLYGRYRKCPECSSWHQVISLVELRAEQVIPSHPRTTTTLTRLEEGSYVHWAIWTALKATANRFRLGKIGIREADHGRLVIGQFCADCDDEELPLPTWFGHSNRPEKLIGTTTITLPSLSELGASADLAPWERTLLKWWWV